jgi:hypothetical protein
MRKSGRFGWPARSVLTASALGTGLLLGGCGMPGAPQPPSLDLPDPVTDLSAVRTGDQVQLTWTMPRKNTDKLLIKRVLLARICRKEGAAAVCSAAGNLQAAPGSDAAYSETLPAPLAAGQPRPLTYFVEILNRKARSAGLSNGAYVAAGQAPAPVEGLSAQMAKSGVLLRWNPRGADAQTGASMIRLDRRLLTPPEPGAKPGEASRKEPGAIAPPLEPLERTLLVQAGAGGRALDTDVRFDQRYEYRAQRVARVTVEDRRLELAGTLSAPVRIDTRNIFPPDTPTELAAVGTAGENGSAPAIDLSWQPDTEADLAGYIVYRREAGNPWRRISPSQPVAGPGFHDSNVEVGHTYFYAVTAIDQNGLESGRSSEANETVPNP